MKKEPSEAGAPRYARERREFHNLLIANPNYFGNLEKSGFKPVLKLNQDTTYEQATCVAFNPLLNLLEAHVQIRLPVGYGSDLCHAGSLEYVRFYVDYGAGWLDAGLVAFDVHNIPDSLDCAKKRDKPLSYVASIPYEPKRDFCGHPVLPRVRAILSWNLQPPPNQPNWPPIWGNVLDQHVQVPPRPRWLLDLVDVIAKVVDKPIELPEEFVAVKELPLPIPEPDPLSIEALVKLYGTGPGGSKGAAVPPHRLASADLAASAAPAALCQQSLVQKPLLYKAIGLDYAEIVAALAKTKADVSFEELRCLGLDTNRSMLAATFVIKRPAGYSGGLCQHGSDEHVAFWADWDNTCEWTYLGTVSIRVHDIAAIPADGLAYTAAWKVNLAAHRRPCKEPKIARVRAVLSWSTPPSATDPDALNTWGNLVDTHVLIPPGPPVVGPGIAIIGGVGVADIDVTGSGMTTANAVFAMYGTPADPYVPSRECPFGGLITIQGAPPFPPSAVSKYRVWVQNVTQGTPASILTGKIWVVNSLGMGSWHPPDPDGFFTYLPDAQNINDLLAYWYSSGDDKWAVWLEFGDAADNTLDTSAVHFIQLDNTGPMTEVHISSGGDCKDFVQGVTVAGSFTATDLHFGHYALRTVPLSMSPNAPVPSSGNASTVGAGWHLDTAGMPPCGYVVELRAYDRSIVGSQPGSWNGGYDDVGLCLRADA